jgi:Fe-S-cluster containining protein
MGQVHTISETRGGYKFLVNNQYTGEKTAVTVDPDKHRLFLDKNIFTDHPGACPFLRQERGDTKAFCTVHLTRPEICRDYGCWRLLILDAKGTRAGRIMYQRAFFSENDHLSRLWAERVDPLNEPDDSRWEKAMIRILTAAGYTIRK